jgi:hypothetical protein
MFFRVCVWFSRSKNSPFFGVPAFACMHTLLTLLYIGWLARSSKFGLSGIAVAVVSADGSAVCAFLFGVSAPFPIIISSALFSTSCFYQGQGYSCQDGRKRYSFVIKSENRTQAYCGDNLDLKLQQYSPLALCFSSVCFLLNRITTLTGTSPSTSKGQDRSYKKSPSSKKDGTFDLLRVFVR